MSFLGSDTEQTGHVGFAQAVQHETRRLHFIVDGMCKVYGRPKETSGTLRNLTNHVDTWISFC